MSGFAAGVSNMAQGLNSAEGAQDAAGAQMGWGQQGLDTSRSIYNAATGKYEPYIATGRSATETLGREAGPTGSLGRAFTMADFYKDPSYQFDLQQGLEAINNSNSVRGGALSGGTQKALAKYATQTASNEFGTAADRFRLNQDRNFGQLSTLAGQGLNAVNAQSSLGANFATGNQAQMNNMGNAEAGGILGRVAGENQAIGGAIGAAGSVAQMGMGS